MISGVQIPLETSADYEVGYIRIKFGNHMTVGKAKTQDFVAKYREANSISAVRAPRVYLAFTRGNFCFIVMEYIAGRMCKGSDVYLIADAVKALITISSPDSTPGPVGGGIIEHPFFLDRMCFIAYKSVGDLQDHINGTGRVQIVGEVNFREELDLTLSVSDLKFVNFIKDLNDRIVAVDFGGYPFLPRSFFGFSLTHDSNPILGPHISKILQYSWSKVVDAMTSASYALVPFGTNNVGLPKRLKSSPARRGL